MVVVVLEISRRPRWTLAEERAQVGHEPRGAKGRRGDSHRRRVRLCSPPPIDEVRA
jgi:hypothetical protein